MCTLYRQKCPEDATWLKQRWLSDINVITDSKLISYHMPTSLYNEQRYWIRKRVFKFAPLKSLMKLKYPNSCNLSNYPFNFIDKKKYFPFSRSELWCCLNLRILYRDFQFSVSIIIFTFQDFIGFNFSVIFSAFQKLEYVNLLHTTSAEKKVWHNSLLY